MLTHLRIRSRDLLKASSLMIRMLTLGRFIHGSVILIESQLYRWPMVRIEVNKPQSLLRRKAGTTIPPRLISKNGFPVQASAIALIPL